MGEDVGEDREHNRRDDGGDNREQCGHEGEDEEGDGSQKHKGATTVHGMALVQGRVTRERLGRPRGNGEWRQEDEDKGEDGGCDEEAEHPVGCDLGDSERIRNVCGESNCRFVSAIFRVYIYTRR